MDSGISIVLPTYNRAYVLPKAIESVLKQTYKKWELFIIDDGSADDTADVVKKYLNDERISYIQCDTNHGANYCRNIGIKKATGEYIAFLDSDNVWNCRKLEVQKMDMDKRGRAICFCRSLFCDGEKEYLFPGNDFQEDTIIYRITRSNCIDTNTALVSRRLLGEELFDEEMPRLQDWEFFFRLIVKKKLSVSYIDKPLNVNYLQSDSITNNRWKYKEAVKKLETKYPDYFGDLSTLVVKNSFLKYVADNNGKVDGYQDELYKADDLSFKILTELACDLLIEKRKSNILMKIIKRLLEEKDSQAFLSKYSGKKIAVYGLGKWGNMLIDFLEKNELNVCEYMDRNVEWFRGKKVKKIGDSIEDVDVVIVSVLDFNEAKTDLYNRYKIPIITIEEVFDDFYDICFV